MSISGCLGLALAIVTMLSPLSAHGDVADWCPEGARAFAAENYEEANLALNSCLYDPPDDPRLAAEGYNLRGRTYLARLDYEAALSDFDLAVELSSDYAAAWRNKAWVHYKLNELHPAIEAIEESLKANPHSTQAHHTHAQILTAMGRELAAMDAYDMAYSFESKETVKKLQEALARQDYEVGATDGVYGGRTREALKACIADGCSLQWQ